MILCGRLPPLRSGTPSVSNPYGTAIFLPELRRCEKNRLQNHSEKAFATACGNKISTAVSKVFSFSRHLSCRNDSLWEVASALLRHTFGVESLRDCHFFARMGKNMKPSGFASCTVRCASWHIVPLHTASAVLHNLSPEMIETTLHFYGPCGPDGPDGQ